MFKTNKENSRNNTLKYLVDHHVIHLLYLTYSLDMYIEYFAEIFTSTNSNARVKLDHVRCINYFFYRLFLLVGGKAY